MFEAIQYLDFDYGFLFWLVTRFGHFLKGAMTYEEIRELEYRQMESLMKEIADFQKEMGDSVKKMVEEGKRK